MDGMYYQPKSGRDADLVVPVRSVAKLLATTVMAGVVVVGVMMALASAGVNLTAPEEFPSIAPDAR